ncbi:hypothetical protein SUGI_0493780 [Cryptomeria japonica]|nr:hypothetical protein SUGI_0493780 [Cryptomeria japonica]
MQKRVSRIDRKEIRWNPRKYNLLQLNFDGATRGNSRILGIGCVIRDSDGQVLVTCYGRIPDGSNNIVEARALLFGVKLDLHIKGNNLVIEGDSQNIISALIKHQTPN